MLRSTVSKVVWVGRATVFLVGLAVILALLFGVASTALAHKGDKGFFHLAHKNVASKVSTLVRQGGGPALNLQVESGPPLAVNSSDTVTNLSSDLLDGKDALEFASAYKSTVVVSPVGTGTQNGTALLDALAGITDASASKPYLLKIEPGVYDLGSSGTLQMKEHVDIEGSGELTTLITSGVSTNGCFKGTVAGAYDAELRFLTVRNTGTTGNCNIAIRNEDAAPRLTHVTVESTAVGENTMGNIGVYNVKASSPTMMSDVTVTVSGGTANTTGVWSAQASAIIKHSRISAPNWISVEQEAGKFSTVAHTQLEGEFDGPVQCFSGYDKDMVAFHSCS